MNWVEAGTLVAAAVAAWALTRAGRKGKQIIGSEIPETREPITYVRPKGGWKLHA
jgi:hypothetical protein